MLATMMKTMKGLAGAAGLVFVFTLFGAGCSDDDSPNGPSGLVPDFSLPDVNPNSATFDSTLSPRDYVGNVSAWYFGHST